MLKWYMAPNNAEEYAAQDMNIGSRKRAHADIQETFCMSLEKGQLVAYPIKEGSDAIENERPYYYHLAGTFFSILHIWLACFLTCTCTHIQYCAHQQ